MGNIYQRENGQWGGRLDIGRDYNVRRKMKYFSGRTKADIKRKIREYNRAAGVIESEKNGGGVYEFVTSLLNKAVIEGDIAGATQLARQMKISITLPRCGSSSDVYGFNENTKQISEGTTSIKHMNAKSAVAL